MKLTQVERQILYNQNHILSILCPEEKKLFELKMTILSDGYTREYGKVVGVGDELDENKCKFIHDVLDMYSDLYYSYYSLKDKTGISEKHVLFQGFDVSNEVKYNGYAQFLIKEEGFEEFSEVDVNSHSSEVETYNRMLAVYKPIFEQKKNNDRDNLTKDEITLIINARKRT